MPTPSTCTGVGWDTPLPLGGSATVNGYTGQPTPPNPNNDPEVTQAENARNTASQYALKAENDYKSALQQYQAVLNGPPDVGDLSANERIKSVTQVLDNAQRARAEARKAVADADAHIAVASINASARAKDPDLKAYYQQHAAEAGARADLDRVQADSLTAKTPAEISELNARAKEATAHAQSLGILTPAQANQLNAQAAQESAQAAQISALTPGLVAKTQAETGLTNAQAVRTQAETTLTGAQAQATLAKLQPEIDNLVATGQLTRAQANAVLANAGLTQAETTKSQQAVQQAQQGPLYGLQDKMQIVQQIADGIRNGTIPPDAGVGLGLLKNSIAASIAGTDVYHATQDAEKAIQDRMSNQIAQRGQNVDFGKTAASTLGSFGSSSLGTLADMNKYATPGSGLGADAFMALMDNFQNRLGAYAPPPTVQSPDMPGFLQQFAAPAPAPAAQAQAPAPAPAAPAADTGSSSAGHTITINIGGAGGAPAVQTAGPSDSGSGTDPMVGNDQRHGGELPGVLEGQDMAMPEHVTQMYPEAAARAGMA